MLNYSCRYKSGAEEETDTGWMWDGERGKHRETNERYSSSSKGMATLTTTRKE